MTPSFVMIVHLEHNSGLGNTVCIPQQRMYNGQPEPTINHRSRKSQLHY